MGNRRRRSRPSYDSASFIVTPPRWHIGVEVSPFYWRAYLFAGPTMCEAWFGPFRLVIGGFAVGLQKSVVLEPHHTHRAHKGPNCD